MKANFKAILLAVSLIGASVTAYANPVLGLDQNPSADAETYSFAHAGFGTDGTFTHWLSFEVYGPRDLSADVSGNVAGGSNTFAFSGFDLYAADQITLLTEGEVASINARISFGGLEGTVSGPATYWLKISGTSLTSGITQASYNGNITTIAAVPEPSTYGMLALGLGLIGFAARSRSKFSA